MIARRRWLLGAALLGVRRRPFAHALAFLSLCGAVFTVALVGSAGSATVSAVQRQNVLEWGWEPTVQVKLAHGVEAGEAERWRRLLERSLGGAGAAEIELRAVPGRAIVGGTPIDDLRARAPSARRVWPLPVLSGRWLEREEGPAVQLVVNEAAAQAAGRLWPARVRWLEGGEVAAIVVGVVDDGKAAPEAYLPLEAVPAGAWRTSAATIHLSARAASEADLLRLVGMLQGSWDDAGAVDAIVPTSTFRRGSEAVAVVARIFLGVAAATLALGALTVANVGLASVRERTRELLLRKAFGAQGWELALLVALEAQLVAVAAAALALPLAYAANLAVVQLLVEPRFAVGAPGFPWEWTAFGVAAGMGAAAWGALAPAVRAARLAVADMMRE